MHQTLRHRMSRGVVYGLLVLWSLVCLFPLYWLAITSLKSETDISGGTGYWPYIDFSPTLRAWNFIFGYASEKFLLRFLNSAVIASAATVLTMCCAILFLYGLTRARNSAGVVQAMLIATFATRMFPPVVTVLPMYLLAQSIGLLDTQIFLVGVYAAINLPVAVWLLQPVFGTRPFEQEDSARLDGASAWRIVFEIVVPMIAPSLFAIGFLVFVVCWNEYLFAAYLAADHAMTLTPWMVGQLSIKEAQVGSEAEEWANLSAASIVMTIPLLIGVAAFQQILRKAHIWRR